MKKRNVPHKSVLLSGLLFLFHSCTEYVLTRYTKTDSRFYEQKIEAGYLVNHNQPNGFPAHSLLVRFRDKKEIQDKKIISVTSVTYGNLDRFTNTKVSALSTDHLVFMKPLSESRNKTLQHIQSDTIKVVIADGSRTETVLFYN